MQYSTATLGSNVVNRLRTDLAAPLIRVGTDVFTVADLMDLRCRNFHAARTLNNAIADLKVRNVRDLYRHVEPEQLAVPGIGSYAFAVLGCLFEAKDVGTLDAWVEQSRVKGQRVTTFATIKDRIHRETTKSVRKPKPRRERNGHAARDVAAETITH